MLLGKGSDDVRPEPLNAGFGQIGVLPPRLIGRDQPPQVMNADPELPFLRI